MVITTVSVTVASDLKVTKPELSTVAVVSSELLHNCVVNIVLLPSDKDPVEVNCWLVPTGIEVSVLAKVTVCKTASLAVMVTAELTVEVDPFLMAAFAVIIAWLPIVVLLTTVTTPVVELTVAILVLELLQVTFTPDGMPVFASVSVPVAVNVVL